MYHNKSFQIFACIVFTFLTSACSKISSAEVDASSIYGEIEVERTESAASVSVDASFYVGGSTGTMIYLVSPASITINGSAGNEVNDFITNRVHYTGQVSATSSAANVVYTDKEGKTYTNAAPVPGILYSSVPASISRSAGFTLSYSTSQAFGGSESLEVTMSNNNSASIQSFMLVTGASSGTQTVSSSTLQDFSTGPISVSVCRKRYATPQAPYPKGLMISVKSCSNPVTVTLAP